VCVCVCVCVWVLSPPFWSIAPNKLSLSLSLSLSRLLAFSSSLVHYLDTGLGFKAWGLGRPVSGYHLLLLLRCCCIILLLLLLLFLLLLCPPSQLSPPTPPPPPPTPPPPPPSIYYVVATPSLQHLCILPPSSFLLPSERHAPQRTVPSSPGVKMFTPPRRKNTEDKGGFSHIATYHGYTSFLSKTLIQRGVHHLCLGHGYVW